MDSLGLCNIYFDFFFFFLVVVIWLRLNAKEVRWDVGYMYRQRQCSQLIIKWKYEEIDQIA